MHRSKAELHQGGPLCTIYFSIYTKDLIRDGVEALNFVAYADDVAIIFKFRDSVDLQRMVDRGGCVFSWSKGNHLSLNLGESDYITF